MFNFFLKVRGNSIFTNSSKIHKFPQQLRGISSHLWKLFNIQFQKTVSTFNFQTFNLCKKVVKSYNKQHNSKRNPLKMVTIYFIQFSLPSQDSFTPLFFNWIFYNSSFYSGEQISNELLSQKTKIVSSHILIPPPSKLNEKKTEEFSQESKPVKKQNSNQKCETEDEEYTPGNAQSKKLKKNQQNQNRNIIPNIVNQILSFVQKKNKSLSTTQKIFEKYNTNEEWSIKRFYLYQNMLKNKISHYVNEETMKIFMKIGNVDTMIYSMDEQAFYNKVSRILIFHFLKTEAQTSTLTSKRMDKTKKSTHIEVQSQLTQKLRQFYKMH